MKYETTMDQINKKQQHRLETVAFPPVLLLF